VTSISTLAPAVLAEAFLRRVVATEWKAYNAAEAGCELRQHAKHMLAELDAARAELRLALTAHCARCLCAQQTNEPAARAAGGRGHG